MKQHLRFRTRISCGLLFASTALASTALASAGLACATQSASAADLVIHVINEQDSNGVAFIALQAENDADKFPDGKAVFAKQIAMTANGKIEFTVKDIPAGTYAVNGFLDLNDNKKLDYNLVGAPTEPYGFSRDARGLFAPPSFAEAAFVIKDDSTRNQQTVKLY